MHDYQQESESEEKVIQAASKAGIQRENKNPEFQHELQLKDKAQKRNDTGLPDHLKSGIEDLSGHSMDDVKVHYNSSKPAQLNAHAYAQGNQIHLAGGQEKHLPHEAWHVVQQKQGRVRPTVNVNGAKVNNDVSLEKEADVMGGKAMQMKFQDSRSRSVPSKVLQSKWKMEEMGKKSIIQLIAVGMIPQVPNNWRHNVNLNDNGATGTEGDEPFSNAQKQATHANNIAQAGGGAPVLPVGNYPQSDSSNNGLVTRALATTLSPEVDHIVPRADNGANDYQNARILSQGENNGHIALGLGRPLRANQRMRVYNNINIDRDMNAPNYVPVNKNINAGTNLVMNDIKSLAHYAGVNVPNNYAAITNAIIVGILDAGNGNNNDVTIA